MLEFLKFTSIGIILGAVITSVFMKSKPHSKKLSSILLLLTILTSSNPVLALTWDFTERPSTYTCSTVGSIVYNGYLTTNPTSSDGSEICTGNEIFEKEDDFFIDVNTNSALQLSGDSMHITIINSTGQPLLRIGQNTIGSLTNLSKWHINTSNVWTKTIVVSDSNLQTIQGLKLENDSVNEEFVYTMYYNSTNVTGTIPYTVLEPSKFAVGGFNVQYTLNRANGSYNRNTYSSLIDSIDFPPSAILTNTGSSIVNQDVDFWFEIGSLVSPILSAKFQPVNNTSSIDIPSIVGWTETSQPLNFKYSYEQAGSYTPCIQLSLEDLTQESFCGDLIGVTDFTSESDEMYNFYQVGLGASPYVLSGSLVYFEYDFSGSECSTIDDVFFFPTERDLLPYTNEQVQIVPPQISGTFSYEYLETDLADIQYKFVPYMALRCSDSTIEYVYFGSQPSLNFADVLYKSQAPYTAKYIDYSNGGSLESPNSLGENDSFSFSSEYFTYLRNEPVNFQLFHQSESIVDDVTFYSDYNQSGSTTLNLGGTSAQANQGVMTNFVFAFPNKGLHYPAVVIDYTNLTSDLIFLGGGNAVTENTGAIMILDDEFEQDDFTSVFTDRAIFGLQEIDFSDWYDSSNDYVKPLVWTAEQTVQALVFITSKVYNSVRIKVPLIGRLPEIISPPAGSYVAMPNQIFGIDFTTLNLPPKEVKYSTNPNAVKIMRFVVSMMLLGFVFKQFITKI